MKKAQKTAAKKRPYDSIIDNILDDREPNWKDLDLADAKASGDEWLDRGHKEVDKDFEDDIAESVSRDTPVWGAKSGNLYENRIAEKEAAQPRVRAVQENWHKDSHKTSAEMSDSESLINELTMSIDKAYSANNLAENSAAKKEISEAQVQKYIKDLLNQGMAPAKVAAKLDKLAEIELFNHQSATDYLQRNAGLLGLAYLEPNSFMDKNSPTYQRTAGKTSALCPECGIDHHGGVNRPLSSSAYAPFGTEHPEDFGCNETGVIKDVPWDISEEQVQEHAKNLQNRAPKNETYGKKEANSNACVQQKKAWDNAGIQPQAKSVKQISACSNCAYFKKDASGKSCNLYHLPVVANTEELTQIVNHLTPGVPGKQKHAALVKIANGEDKRVQNTVVASQTNLVKTADAKVRNQEKRAAYTFHDERETSFKFSSDHVSKMHEKGVSLARIAKWAGEKKFPETDVSFAFRGFVNNLKKDAKGKIILAKDDLTYLNRIGIRNEAFSGAQKCASCPLHFNRETREYDQARGAQRVDQKFASRTVDAVRNMQPKVKEVNITVLKVRQLHQAGHSVEKIYKSAARKIGSVQAKKVIAGFIENIKKTPGKLSVSAADRSFLEGKLGFKPDVLRTLNPDRRPLTQVVANVPMDANILSYPGMGKQAGEKKHTDGHSILAEYDLTGAQEMPDIESNKNDYDVELGSTFKVDLN